MENKVILCADRSCDLNDELVARYQVHYVYANITLENKICTDCIDIFPEDLYQAFWDRGALPKTTAISAAQYIEAFQPFVEQGYEIVHICMSSAASAAYQNCCLAAGELGHVYPVDSHNISSAIGLLVIEAGERIARNMPAKQVAQEVQDMTGRSHCSFVLDTLEFMKAGGRCSAMAAFGANLLNLKPCIVVDNQTGVLGVEKKYRGNINKVYLQYIDERLAMYDKIKPDHVMLTHSGLDPQVETALYQYIKDKNYFKEIHITRASCTVSTHCGPHTMGILFITE